MQSIRCTIASILFLIFLPATLLAQSATARISSHEQLTRYLRETPAGTSPLDALSPGSRKRFIDQLVFRDHGLSDLDLGEPVNELTHLQAVQLLALFGVESSADGVGVSEEARARLERENRVDAIARRCDVKTCQESAIEQAYDQLVLDRADSSLPDAGRSAVNADHYDRLFKNYSSSSAVAAASSPDLRLLKRAVEFALFYRTNQEYIARLTTVLAAMQRRRMVDDLDYETLYQALITIRQFGAAKALAETHVAMRITVAPTLLERTPLPRGLPTALSVDLSGRAMEREAFDLSVPLRIVVVASCHFSQDAAHAIAADPRLHALFVRHAVWLASQSESFGAVAQWNGEFPDQPIHIAWKDSDWPMLDSWNMPTFYVFRDGRLAGKFSGWHGVESLSTSLQKAGALR